MGRPLKDINAEQVRKLASFGCTYREIGAWFNVDESTVRKRFSREYEQGVENGKISLRRLQWKRAYAGSDTMLIHLGKNYLGQADKSESKIEGHQSVVILPSNGRESPPDDPAPEGAAMDVPE